MTRDENSAPCKASLRLYGTQNAMGIQIYTEDEKMEKGYYLCKVLKVDTPYKKIHTAQILYWDGKRWLDKEDSYFETKQSDVKCSIKIPDTYYEKIIV